MASGASGVQAADPAQLGANQSAVDLPIAVPAKAKMVFADEFDRPGLPDPKVWDYDTDRNSAGWYNNEKQYYARARPANSRVEGGVLIIEAHKESFANGEVSDWGGQTYTSARLLTRGRKQFTYGFYEIRAKLPCGRGLWPAIWMLGTRRNTGWPAVGEIDIMEYVGWDPTTVHATIHTQAYNHAQGTQRGSRTTVPTACGGWHRYQLDWTKDRILIGIDDRAYMRFANDKSGSRDSWPFDDPHYLILNLAIGGWGGQQGIDDSVFPARFEVDYVRVWQTPK